MKSKKGKERVWWEIHTIERFCQGEQCSSCNVPFSSFLFRTNFRVATDTKRRYLNLFLHFVGFFVSGHDLFVFFNTRILARHFAAAAEDQD